MIFILFVQHTAWCYLCSSNGYILNLNKGQNAYRKAVLVSYKESLPIYVALHNYTNK